MTATFKTDPAIRTDVIVTIGKKTPNLAAPPSPEPDGSDPYSIGVSQWAYSGSRPRTASK